MRAGRPKRSTSLRESTTRGNRQPHRRVDSAARRAAFFTLAVALSGCAAPVEGPGPTAALETAIGGEADQAAVERGIDAIYHGFTAGYAALDADAVADLYTEDALYLPPEGDILRGRQAIREIFAAFFEQVAGEGRKLVITFDIVDRDLDGALAYDVGYYDLTRLSAEDEELGRSRGKFTTVAKRGDDGIWRFHVDCYSAVPEPPQ